MNAAFKVTACKREGAKGLLPYPASMVPEDVVFCVVMAEFQREHKQTPPSFSTQK